MRELVLAQSARFAALDPLLPEAAQPPAGERLTATLADGRRVAGVLYRARHAPGSLTSLWAAGASWELTPLLGDTGGAGMAALLGALRRRLDRERVGPDSACAVTWPSRDVEVARVLLDHGLVPLDALGVRPRPPPPAGTSRPEVVIRRARAADEEEIVALRMAELRYSALVGPNTVREDAAEVLAAEVRTRLRRDEPAWLAESAGLAVGLAGCGWGARAGEQRLRLRPGRWGQLHTLSVLPAARGTGIGRALAAVAHDALRAGGARGTFLFYSPANPLSSVFWHRQGYRPLWTFWEVRPASALR
ncbi:GNAT family N-acetyltransferase [Amycolatopsis cihanbeyliensis]|uniref:Ribosomal protein S18 acetylase RimI-like enzyme n=1 Tax=Amycolatopsis cihanbeyliensis TaxID=1128664 RepID=A0A542DEQ0_AMYCI|nr:GNAT family N-acetyltransferase [Amycolatopsis cihanbeyliensis]TQJ01558.1 ribosomal protein S18 acetylase RimI-like enzyme [Amycolatopsis cihanbeyliensis]